MSALGSNDEERNRIIEAMEDFAHANKGMSVRRLVEELMEAASTGISYAIAELEESK